MKRFLKLLMAIFVFIPVLSFPSSSIAADCGAGVPPGVASQDLANVLFVLSGNLVKNEIKVSQATTIKNDIRSALNNAGIKAEITEKKGTITAGRFLKVHIYSILLERQVFYCSVAIIQQFDSNEEECVVTDYSNITSQAGKIRSQIQDLMADILQDVR